MLVKSNPPGVARERDSPSNKISSLDHQSPLYLFSFPPYVRVYLWYVFFWIIIAWHLYLEVTFLYACSAVQLVFCGLSYSSSTSKATGTTTKSGGMEVAEGSMKHQATGTGG